MNNEKLIMEALRAIMNFTALINEHTEAEVMRIYNGLEAAIEELEACRMCKGKGRAWMDWGPGSNKHRVVCEACDGAGAIKEEDDE